jgi:signal transduction histidine kinase/CheY-like chemotaxis protein
MEDKDIDYKLIFESVPAGLYLIIDMEYNIVAVTDAYLEATFTERKNILGRYIFDVFPDNPINAKANGVNNLKQSFNHVVVFKETNIMPVQKYDIKKKNSDEFEERYWSPMNSPIFNKNNDLIYIAHRVKDVTEFVHAQKREQYDHFELKKMEHEIFDRNIQIGEQMRVLDRMNIELAKARDKAIEAVNIKSIFIANISHELRTPLTGIIGACDLLNTRTYELTEQKNLLNMISESANLLLTVVNDILDISKLEAGKMSLNLENCNIHEIINNTLTIFMSPAKEKNINLKSNIENTVPVFNMCDPNRFKQIIFNLISNAIKFTPQNGQVTINVERKNDFILFEIIDTGIGINKDKQHLLFQPFSQINNSIKYSGTGLGLCIVKQLILLMKGEINFKSKINEGSTFWFTLPISSKGTSKLEQKKENKYDKFNNANILFVEDTFIIQQLLRKQLSELNISFDIVSNGKEALDIIKKNKQYDIIFMDCYMPIMNGFIATAEIRKLDNYKNTPIIAMTASSSPNDFDVCLKAGMTALLSKPFSLRQLHDKIKMFIKN